MSYDIVGDPALLAAGTLWDVKRDPGGQVETRTKWDTGLGGTVWDFMSPYTVVPEPTGGPST